MLGVAAYVAQAAGLSAGGLCAIRRRWAASPGSGRGWHHAAKASMQQGAERIAELFPCPLGGDGPHPPARLHRCRARFALRQPGQLGHGRPARRTHGHAPEQLHILRQLNAWTATTTSFMRWDERTSPEPAPGRRALVRARVLVSTERQCAAADGVCCCSDGASGRSAANTTAKAT